MAKKISNREKTECLIYKNLISLLKDPGYSYLDSGPRKQIRYRYRDVSWQFHISLHEQRPPYAVLEGVGIIHEKLSEIINDLAKEKFPDQHWWCGTGTHLLIYWGEGGNGQRLNGIEDIDRFVQEYIDALNRAKLDFLLPYSNQEKLINDCCLFYTKWPKSMGPFDTALALIADGIQKSDRDKIQMGVDRIYQKRTWGHSDSVREIPFFIRQKVIDMGLAVDNKIS